MISGKWRATLGAAGILAAVLLAAPMAAATAPEGSPAILGGGGVDQEVQAQRPPAEPVEPVPPSPPAVAQDGVAPAPEAVEGIEVEVAPGNPLPTENRAEPSRGESRAEIAVGAQIWMARWAGVQAALTALALFLIWRTLTATNRTLNEAKAATKATQDAVQATREIGEAQTRAYIAVTESIIEREVGSQNLEAIITVSNTGNSPAKDLRISYRAAIRNEEYRIQTDFAPKSHFGDGFGTDVAARETRPFNHMFTDFPLTEDEGAQLDKGALSVPLIFEAIVEIKFVDVFGKEIHETQKRMAMLQGAMHSPFFSVVFLGFEMVERANEQAEQNK